MKNARQGGNQLKNKSRPWITTAMNNIAQQCAGYRDKIQSPPWFVVVMLTNIADPFNEKNRR